MRKLIAALVVLIALAIAAAFALPLLVDVNQYRGRIQSELQQRLRRTVKLGELSLRVIPLAIRVERLEVGESPALQSDKPFAAARELYVRVGLLALLQGQVRVESLRLLEPRIELIRDRNGVWNYASLGGGTADSGGQKGATPGIQNLQIEDGVVAITDRQKKEARAVYDHIDLDLNNFSPGRKFDLQLTVHLPGPGRQTLVLAGKGGPLDTAGVMASPFDGTMALDEASLGGLRKFLRTDAVAALDGTLTGKASIQMRNRVLGLQGDLRLADLKTRSHSLKETISLDYQLRQDMSRDELDLTRMNVKLGGMTIQAKGKVETKATPAVLHLEVTAANATIDEVAQLAAAAGVAFDPDVKVRGLINAQLRAEGPAGGPALSGSLQGSRIEIRGEGWPEPVRVAELALDLTPETIRSRPFTIESGATRLNGSFALAGYTSKNPTVDAGIKAPSATLTELLRIAHAVGVEAARGISGTGNAAVDVLIHGPVKNPAYSGSLSLQNGSVELPSLRKPLQIGSASLRFEQNSAKLDNVAMSLGSSHLRGEISIRNFAAPELEFRADIDQVNVDELRQLSAGGPDGKEGKTRGAAGLRGSGSITIGKLVLQKLVMNRVQAACVLDKGLIRLDPVTAELYGGKQTGSISIDTRPERTVYGVRTKLELVDADQLLTSATSWRGVLKGALNLEADTQFTAFPGVDIARSLNGRTAFDLKDGKIAGINIVNEIAGLAGFLGYAKKQAGLTDVAKLSGSMNFRDGVGATEDLRLEFAGGGLSAAGTMNLIDQAMNMRLTSVFDREFSQRVGGQQIGGFLTTALANGKGELVILSLVSGTFPNIRFAPDPQRMAEMRAKNLFPTSGDPAKRTTEVIDTIRGKGGKGVLDVLRGGQATTVPPAEEAKPSQQAEPAKPAQQTAPEQKQAPNTFRDLMEQLKSRGKQKEEPKK
ncbi:MAG: AsmA family protein [Bryobacteraceae bacterium]